MLRKLWKRVNGKKTVSGIILTVLGVVMVHIPFTAPAAIYFITTGLASLGIGGTHKIIKYKEKRDGTGKS